jgi:hypothetical protein
MEEFSTKIGVWNDRQQPWPVHVEPWGEYYTMLPGERLEIVAFGRTVMPWFNGVERGNTTQVYCEDTADFAVYQDGQLLLCGHNRQP